MTREGSTGEGLSTLAMAQESEPHLAGLYGRWRKPLERILGRYFKTPADIEDAAQEVFTRMAAVKRALPLEEERPYLAQVARSVASFWQRKTPAQAGVQAVSIEECREEAEAVPAEGRGDTLEAVQQRQQLQRLRDALRELPERQRQAFVLHRVEELTLVETALRMGITERMVSRHLSRAMAYCELRMRYASAEQMRQFALSQDDLPDTASAERPAR